MVVATALTAAVAHSWRANWPDSASAPSPAVRTAATAAAADAREAPRNRRPTPRTPASSDRSRAPSADEASGHDRWSGVLRRLDDRRARAWRTGRPGLLRLVYVAGSSSLRRDAAMLRAYAERGLRVRGVRMHYLAVTAADRRGAEIRLTTVDRLGPAVVRIPGGTARSLPRDRPTRHEVALRRVPDGWRIAWIRAA